MKIKYISYVGDNNMQSLNKTHEFITEKLSSLDRNNDGFEFCQTHGEMLKVLGESFSSSDVTVLLINLSDYIKTKSLLFKAMNIRCVKNAEVIEKIKSDENLSYLNEKQIDAHSALPQNAEPFVMQDGLFSGFGIKSQGQKLLVLPIDETRIDESICEKVYEFIAPESEEAEVPVETEIVEEFAEEEAQETVSPKQDEQEVFETEQNQPLYGAGGVDDLVAETFTNIGYSHIKIAFGVQEDNFTVDEYFRSKIVFRNTGLFTVVNVKKTIAEEDEQKNKAALSQIARSSMLNANASIGMAVSEVMVDENNKKYVLSAMCDAKKTNIYKVFALPDENDEDIIISAIGNMFAILNSRVLEYNERLRMKNSEGEEEDKKQDKKKSKVPLIILIIILALLAVAVGLVVYSRYAGDGMIYNIIEKIKNYILSLT